MGVTITCFSQDLLKGCLKSYTVKLYTISVLLIISGFLWMKWGRHGSVHKRMSKKKEARYLGERKQCQKKHKRKGHWVTGKIKPWGGAIKTEEVHCILKENLNNTTFTVKERRPATARMGQWNPFFQPHTCSSSFPVISTLPAHPWCSFSQANKKPNKIKQGKRNENKRKKMIARLVFLWYREKPRRGTGEEEIRMYIKASPCPRYHVYTYCSVASVPENRLNPRPQTR